MTQGLGAAPGITSNRYVRGVDLQNLNPYSITMSPAANRDANLQLNKSASGLRNQIYGNTAGVARWLMSLGDGTAESGSNAGSDFTLVNCSDNGAGISAVITIPRATGVVAFAYPPTNPTPAAYDISNQSATTAFVAGALGNNPQPNPIDNCEFFVNQKTAAPNAGVSGTPDIVSDRWSAWRTGNVTGAQIGLYYGPPGYAYGLSLGRLKGDTSAASINLAQIMEPAVAYRYQGQTVTVSFQVEVMAGYTGGTIGIGVATGTGSFEGRAKLAAGTWSGYALQTTQVTPGAAGVWKKVSATFQIPATATEIALVLSANFAGTAQATEQVVISGVQWDVGPNAGPNERVHPTIATARCQRFSVYSSALYQGYFGAASSTFATPVVFPVAMYGPPTITQTNSTATNCSTTTGKTLVTVLGYFDTRVSTAAGAGSWQTTFYATCEP